MFEARSDEEIKYAGSAVGLQFLSDCLNLLPVPLIVPSPLHPFEVTLGPYSFPAPHTKTGRLCIPYPANTPRLGAVLARIRKAWSTTAKRLVSRDRRLVATVIDADRAVWGD